MVNGCFTLINCKKTNPHISPQNVSCYTIVFTIDHKYKVSCEKERNPKGFSACMIKMLVLVGKELEVLKHVWPSNVSMFILLRLRMFTQARSAVTLSLETRSERSDPSSGNTAGVIPAQLCGCSPVALEYQLVISQEHCWVQHEAVPLLHPKAVRDEVWWMNVR